MYDVIFITFQNERLLMSGPEQITIREEENAVSQKSSANQT